MKLPKNFQFDFQQKRALVTGAGKGIGREIACMLHSFNAQVVALSRTERDLQSLKEEINCETIFAELGDPDAARRAAVQAGDIDFLVNNVRSPSSNRFWKLRLKPGTKRWLSTFAPL